MQKILNGEAKCFYIFIRYISIDYLNRRAMVYKRPQHTMRRIFGLFLFGLFSCVVFSQENNQETTIENLQGKWESKFVFGDSGTVIDVSKIPQFFMIFNFRGDVLYLYSKLTETETPLKYRMVLDKVIQCYREDSPTKAVMTFGIVSLSEESLVVIIDELSAKILFNKVVNDK